MFGGHVGIALGAKGIRSTIPLWLLLLATQIPDWTDAAVCTAGLSPGVSFGVSSSPSEMLSHSFPAIGVLAAVMALLYYAASRDGRASVLIAAVVVSHAFADFLTGLKPTWPGGPRIGLQLYQQPAIDFVVEAAVIVIGWIIYRKSLAPERRNSSPVIAMLVAILLLQLAASLSFALFPGMRKC
jgi:hypothetical protein